MTFWPLTNSDFPTDQTFHQFHDLYTELDLHRIMSGFHGAFATGVASQQGTLTLPDTWFRPPFWDLLMLQLLRPIKFLELAMSLLDFSPRIPLGTFSILLHDYVSQGITHPVFCGDPVYKLQRRTEFHLVGLENSETPPKFLITKEVCSKSTSLVFPRILYLVPVLAQNFCMLHVAM